MPGSLTINSLARSVARAGRTCQYLHRFHAKSNIAMININHFASGNATRLPIATAAIQTEKTAIPNARPGQRKELLCNHRFAIIK